MRFSAAWSTIAIRRSPSCPVAVIGKKLLILCTHMPSLTVRIRALLHGFDYVHLDLGYFGTKSLSSA